MFVGPQGIPQHERIPIVILGSRHRVPVPKPVHLLRINREHRKGPLHQALHHRSTRGLDRDRYSLWFSFTKLHQPVHKLSDSRSAMGDRSPGHYMRLPIQHTNFITLCSPIDSHIPLIVTFCAFHRSISPFPAGLT